MMRVSKSVPLLTAVAALAGTACAPDASRTGTSDLDALPLLELQEEFRLGSVSDPDLGFSNIGGVAVGEGGTIYVSELRDRKVRAYQPDGTLLWAVGGPGQGPGEFSTLSRFGVIGDTLWVTDQVSGRITLFGPGGRLLETLTPPPIPLPDVPDGVNVTLVPGELRPGGHIATSMRMMVMAGSMSQATPAFGIPELLIDRHGTVLDTLAVWPSGGFAFPERITVAGRQVVVPSVPSDVPLSVTAGDVTYRVEREVAASPEAGVLIVTRLHGPADTVFRHEYGYRPLPYTQARIDSLIAPAVRGFVGAADDPGTAASAVRSALLAALTLPPFQPPVSAARMGTDHALWLMRTDQGGATRAWALFDNDGRPRGVLDVPRGLSPHWSSGDTLWAAVRDEFDVPWLVRYRIGQGG